MTWQAYMSTRPRFLCLVALSAIGLFGCAAGSSTGDGAGGSNGPGSGGSTGSHAGGTTGGSVGGTTGGSVGGTTGGSSGGTTGGSTGGMTGGGTGGKATGGTTGSTGGMTGGGTGGKATGGTTGGTGGMTGTGGCANTNMNVINEDSSGYVCNNKWGIQGAWYCYTDGSDSSNSCKGSDGKGAGMIPWTTASNAMCLSGTMGNNTSAFAGIGFKVNSGPPGSTAAPGTFNASSLVGFAITLAPGASGKGSGGMILNIEYPTSTDLDSNTKDAPGVTVPGVPGTGTITYNALFADSVLANNKTQHHAVDPNNLTDVKIAFFPDSVSHTYDFCIKSIVPLMAPSPTVAAGAYGPSWTNQTGQAVNGINGYAVQSAPFPMNGNPMTMQVNATAGGVGFTYAAGGGFQAPNNGPGSFPAVISGWGPGEAGIQFYGPYKGGKTIGALTSVKSSWTFTQGSSGDSVYDVWFGNSAAPAVPGVELMIWMGNKDKMPIGFGTAAGPALTGSDGVSRTPYVGTNGTQQMVVSYWIPTGTQGNASNFDVLAYFKDAASHGYAGLSTGSFLLGIQTGFEVYGGTWTTTDYNINIQ